MNAMANLRKVLALMPVVALAACGGVAPTSSTDVASDLSATQGGGVSAQALRPSPTNPCKLVESIHLQVVESTPSAVWVEATYKYSQPTMTDCAAPTFTSNVRGLQIDPAHPFRAGLLRVAASTAKLTATAPTGVSATIQVDLTGPSDTDPVTDPTLTPTRTPESPSVDNACKAVAGVTVTAAALSADGDVNLVATYTYLSPTLADCTVAPAWDATRRGLVVTKDAFRATIPANGAVKTTVYATAPNGVRGEVTF